MLWNDKMGDICSTQLPMKNRFETKTVSSKHQTAKVHDHRPNMIKKCHVKNRKSHHITLAAVVVMISNICLYSPSLSSSFQLSNNILTSQKYKNYQSHLWNQHGLKESQWGRGEKLHLAKTSASGKGKKSYSVSGNKDINNAVKVAVSTNQQGSILSSNVVGNGVNGKSNTVDRLEQELRDIKLSILSRIQNNESKFLQNDESLREQLDILSYRGLSNRNNKQIQKIGMEALQIQLNLDFAVKSSTVLSAIRYLCNFRNGRSTAISHSIFETDKYTNTSLDCSIMAYRLLQRLITGMGINNQDYHISNDQSEMSNFTTTFIREHDICAVLNALVRSNKRNLAYQLLLLQERISLNKTYKRPTGNIVEISPVSAVGYSILIRAYSRSQNLAQVESLLTRAYKRGVEPDIIFLNSVIDAYVNCDAYDKADIVFRSMRRNPNESLQPNTRTYNTLMKGMAKRADVKAALKLSSEMEQQGKFDAISVNTLVNAMVQGGEFGMAEKLLDKNSDNKKDKELPLLSYHNTRTRKNVKHPHVEAYTELLDGYAKANMPTRAFVVFDKMMERGVTPNEITYTCLVHALGVALYCKRARKVLLQQQRQYEEGNKRIPVVMVNAYLTGLLSLQDDHDKRVNEAVFLFHEMMNNTALNCRPNSVTALTLIEGLSKSNVTKVDDIKALVDVILPEIEERHDLMKVQTALLRAYCRRGLDAHNESLLTKDNTDKLFINVDSIYRSIARVDTIAMNAYLDACCRFRRFRGAFDEFKIRKESRDMKPDVATYTILISALLTNFRDSRKAADRARELYHEMKNEMGIRPDTALVDM